MSLGVHIGVLWLSVLFEVCCITNKHSYRGKKFAPVLELFPHSFGKQLIGSL